MMKKKFLIVFGSLLSLILLVVVFYALDWHAFFTALKTIRIPELLLAGGVVIIVIALRSLRWNLVTRMPLTHFKHFWQAANIGYLGNIIYPARAGEVLRVVALHHFASLKFGRALSSAVIDRMLDMIVVGIFTLLVLWIHGHKIDPNVGKGVIGIFILATLILTLLVIFVDRLFAYVQQWTTQKKWQKQLQELLLHGLEGIQVFRHTSNIVTVLLLTTFIFMLDYFWMWQVMLAFGWDLPFEAALTVGVFLLVSISLPSAPGYVGIFQVACVLALGLYGIDQSLAVAYSIVLQLLSFSIMAVQGTLVTLYCGFNLSQERQEATGDQISSLKN
ncbi:MAG: flippase-like domain-containing protein [Thiomargarita sp.]|nr:flippase-like domain-containing protein [Thiomargarita sp.]